MGCGGLCLLPSFSYGAPYARIVFYSELCQMSFPSYCGIPEVGALFFSFLSHLIFPIYYGDILRTKDSATPTAAAASALGRDLEHRGNLGALRALCCCSHTSPSGVEGGHSRQTQSLKPRSCNAAGEAKHPIVATSKERLPVWLRYITAFSKFLQCLALWDFHPLKIFSVRWNFLSLLVMLPPRTCHHGECCCRLQGRHSTPCEER
jgi:hypothetical protein